MGLVIVLDILEDPVDVGDAISLLVLAVHTLLALLVGVILIGLAGPEALTVASLKDQYQMSKCS